MGLYTKDFDSTKIDSFIILHKDGRVIVTKSNDTYLMESDIVFDQQLASLSDKKDIFKALNQNQKLPSQLREAIALRTRNLKGEQLNLFTSASHPSTFCDDKNFSIHYGITDPCAVTLTIIDTFDNEKEFDASFSKTGDEVFGFWDHEKNTICSSFFWMSPMQTKMCFSDFGRHAISCGSLFLKLSFATKQ